MYIDKHSFFISGNDASNLSFKCPFMLHRLQRTPLTNNSSYNSLSVFIPARSISIQADPSSIMSSMGVVGLEWKAPMIKEERS